MAPSSLRNFFRYFLAGLAFDVCSAASSNAVECSDSTHMEHCRKITAEQKMRSVNINFIVNVWWAFNRKWISNGLICSSEEWIHTRIPYICMCCTYAGYRCAVSDSMNTEYRRLQSMCIIAYEVIKSRSGDKCRGIRFLTLPLSYTRTHTLYRYTWIRNDSMSLAFQYEFILTFSKKITFQMIRFVYQWLFG